VELRFLNKEKDTKNFGKLGKDRNQGESPQKAWQSDRTGLRSLPCSGGKRSTKTGPLRRRVENLYTKRKQLSGLSGVRLGIMGILRLMVGTEKKVLSIIGQQAGLNHVGEKLRKKEKARGTSLPPQGEMGGEHAESDLERSRWGGGVVEEGKKGKGAGEGRRGDAKHKSGPSYIG